MTKFIEIIDGDIVWVGVRFTDAAGNEIERKLYPSCKVGDCRRPGVRM